MSKNNQTICCYVHLISILWYTHICMSCFHFVLMEVFPVSYVQLTLKGYRTSIKVWLTFHCRCKWDWVELLYRTFFLYKFCSRAKWLTFFKSGNMTWTLTGEVPTEISLNEDNFLAILLKFTYLSAPVGETVLLSLAPSNCSQFWTICENWMAWKISFEKCIYMLLIAVLPQALIGLSKFQIRKRSTSSDLHSKGNIIGFTLENISAIYL